jgi:hypothetical protein
MDRFINVLFKMLDGRMTGIGVDALLDLAERLEFERDLAEGWLCELEEMEVIEIYGHEIFSR